MSFFTRYSLVCLKVRHVVLNLRRVCFNTEYHQINLKHKGITENNFQASKIFCMSHSWKQRKTSLYFFSQIQYNRQNNKTAAVNNCSDWPELLGNRFCTALYSAVAPASVSYSISSREPWDIPGSELGEAFLSVLHQLHWWAKKMWLPQALCGLNHPLDVCSNKAAEQTHKVVERLQSSSCV